MTATTGRLDTLLSEGGQTKRMWGGPLCESCSAGRSCEHSSTRCSARASRRVVDSGPRGHCADARRWHPDRCDRQRRLDAVHVSRPRRVAREQPDQRQSLDRGDRLPRHRHRRPWHLLVAEPDGEDLSVPEFPAAPCNVATPAPQAFSVAFRPATSPDPRSPFPNHEFPSRTRCALHPSPDPSGEDRPGSDRPAPGTSHCRGRPVDGSHRKLAHRGS